MTDRALLEMAAKAAGYTLTWGEEYIVDGELIDCTDIPYVVSGQPDEANWYWDPLTDDGDALRLAVKLHIAPVFDPRYSMVHADPIGKPLQAVSVDYGTDPYAATRRAIVRTAAEIGKAMQ